MAFLKQAQDFLLDLGRRDLATLVRGGSYQVKDVTGEWGPVRCVCLTTHPTLGEAISNLAPDDKRRIIEAIAHADDALKDVALDPEDLVVAPDKALSLDWTQEVVAELIAQRNLMIAVATGGPRINEVNDYYRARRRRIERLLSARSLTEPNRFDDLWDWYKHWSQHLASYAERRRYVADLYDDLISGVADTPVPPSPPREPTGWDRVDRVLEKARERLDSADSEEDFQSVGHLCREILISLGQAVHDPNEHPSSDGIDPSNTDAKRMIDAFLAATVPGEANEAIRRHAKAALALALDLQHRRTANFRVAALCLEATASTVNIVAILAGRRDGDGIGAS